ncbi:helix-turn-helix transcriptional regulator [Actinomadura macrotermitis]|uniref:HTH cro/C1-type domain-containing protein n=1 Tax=Actinomadura macrotermitis TaxID=2585200 RepID=A0A7K0BRU2_9ACTN|nr:helix-turn-helix transcriptional regulator [Actinomadura macrotermitis]MQY03424.1 hypothetical protein [Actinomadura macrotermitis]
MERRSELAEFLRSRRARLTPEEAGLPPFGGRRRVPGLRREELAQLAGVSVDYYVRLEQGRAANVSQEVLGAVARALRLDDAEHAHLRNLAQPRRRAPVRRERVRPQVQRLLDVAEGAPSYVIGQWGDTLAWNRLAAALFVDFGALAPRDRNWLRMVFLNEEMRSRFTDWPTKARETVAFLRMRAGEDPEDPYLTELVGELSLKSPDFRRWWAGHDVKEKGRGRKPLRHPIVGDLVLDYETLRLPEDPGQTLVTYLAEAGSPAEEALRLLGSWAAPAAAERESSR